MSSLIEYTLYGWIPLTCALFLVLQPRRAVLASFIGGWLFLPTAGIQFAGLPDLTKITATSIGAVLGILIFDLGRLLKWRPKWIDIPMAVWCLVPIAASVTNGLGWYDGVSFALDKIFMWGVPWLVGRLYFNDVASMRDLAVGVFIGGLVYAPLCLYEIRMSPQLHRMVYGFHPSAFVQSMRYGGFRPTVFMHHGLMLGLWMSSATLAGLWLWRSGALRALRSVPVAFLVVPLLGVTVLCKSTGALMLLVVALTLLFATRALRVRWLILAALTLPPTYITVRSQGLWNGEQALALARLIDEDRARSFEFRLENEDLILQKALQKPVVGWGGWGRWRVFDDEGRDITVSDGLWVIALGETGLVGLAAMVATILLPVAMLVRRIPATHWGHPATAPALVVGMILVMFSLDTLHNAMVNPVYLLGAGGLGGLCLTLPVARRTRAATVPARREGGHMQAERHDTLLIVPALRAERGANGSFVLTRKFVDGVREYARRWPGPVTVAVEETPRNDANLDHLAVDAGSEPFGLTWIGDDAEAVAALVRESRFVLASLVPQHERMASICRDLDVPMAFVTEYTLETRRRIIGAETRNPLRRVRRLCWEQRREARHRQVVALADGVQCNGTPTWEAYHEINRSPLLYFDTRVRADMVATPAALTERMTVLRAGGPLRLAFSGRLTAMKGADHLAAVARCLDGLGIEYRFDICGAGDLEPSIAKAIASHGLAERVRLRGVLDFHDELMPFMIRDVDLFVCCHRQGDPSCTYLETMACGTPIVGYANEAWRGIVTRSRTGWITPMDEPRAMAQCIAALDRRRSDLAVAAVAARRFALAHTFEKTMQRRIDHMLALARSVPLEAGGMKELCVVILNYRRSAMTIESLASLAEAMEDRPDRAAVVVDNASDDGSADAIAAAIESNGWGAWARLVRSPRNGGFAAGNNLGVEAVDARRYLLLNSDARVRCGAVDRLAAAMDEHPEAGLIGPRLEDEDGTPQVSCFRYRSPISEMLEAAGTSLLDRVFRHWLVALPLTEAPCEAPWVSFACIMIRREVFERVGPMDERYFMYFEDIDYARHARRAGFTIRHEPAARVVHLRGGTSSVKAAMQERRRVPRYYYESRSRYFARYYGGRPGLWMTNVLWLTGRSIAAGRELVGGKRPHARELEARDNWTNWLRPWRAPRLPGGGEL